MHFQQSDNTKDIKDLKTDVRDLKDGVNKLMFLFMAENSVDIASFIPIPDAATLNQLMNRSHPDWPKRLKSFEAMMYACVADNVKEFSENLKNNIFSREYAAEYKWPPYG